MQQVKKTFVNQSFAQHLQSTYGANGSALRGSATEVWNLRIGPAQRLSAEWRTELQMAAHQIAALAKSEIQLYVDGSWMSQVMVQAFKWARISFRAAVPRFEKDLNIHAVSQAIAFLESNEVRYQVYDLNIEKLLLSEEAIQWSKRFSTDRAPQIVAMKVWERLSKNEQFVVFPFGLPSIEKKTDGWKTVEYENFFGLFQFQKDRQLKGVSHFYKWSPELIFSFLQDPVLRAIVTNLRPAPVGGSSLYKEIFQNYFVLQGSIDWHGFEKISFLIKKYLQLLAKSGAPTLTAYSFNFMDYCNRLEYRPQQAQPLAKPALAKIG